MGHKDGTQLPPRKTERAAGKAPGLLGDFYDRERRGLYDDALNLAQQAINANPKNPEAFFALGLAQNRLEQLDLAVDSYRQSLRLNPLPLPVWDNLGLTLMAMNRIQEAREAFVKALAIDPQHASAHWHLALCDLLRGDLAQGFAGFHWRWQLPEQNRREILPLPALDGAMPLAGKTVLLVDEQGFGDTLQFARYVPLLRERGARVLLLLSPPLVPFFKGWDDVAVFARGDKIMEKVDAYAALPDLPHLLQTTLATIPRVPRDLPIEAKETDAEKWRGLLAPHARRRRKIGINWAGKPTHLDDKNRSSSLSQFLTAIHGHDDLAFFSLQKPLKADEADLLAQSGIPDLGSSVGDFADAARLYRELDLVITVDSAPAHLAGTLNIPVWILLAFAPDWRWMLDRPDSPWYPSARLFRPPATRAWHDVFQAVRDALTDFKKSGARA